MAKVFVKKIPGREIEVDTRVVDDEWEIFFKGTEVEQAKLTSPVYKMWDKDSDPEGKEAEKVHTQAVILLEAGTDIKKTVLEVEALISTIVDKIYG